MENLLGFIRLNSGPTRLLRWGATSRKGSEGQLLSLMQSQRIERFGIGTAVSTGSIVSMTA